MKAIITIVIVVIVIIVGAMLLRQPAANLDNNSNSTTTIDVTATTTQSTGTTATSTATSTTAQTVSDGTIKLTVPVGYGLATNSGQILVKSYIPACDQNIEYCAYYNGTAYKGTNFESAGLRIAKRTDLTAERACLDTPPDGYGTSTQSGTGSGPSYSTSAFKNLGDGAAGHLSSGSLYRMFIPSTSSCYEFQTRITKSQFGNYPAGSIKEFTSSDQASLMSKLGQILESISLPNGQKNLFANL